MFKNKKILIIGGTGALGQTLLKRYCLNNTIAVFSRDEHKHVALGKEYKNVQFIIGDIKNKNSILYALNVFKPEIVINAAALKHVPVCETNSFESVNTNIIGHQNLIEAVLMVRNSIESVIFISTDKACKPINIYGMCKAISERLYINFSQNNPEIKTIIVRYGNVLESTGSVIPIFKNILKSGNTTLPITHPDMTRFLMSLDDAVDLIQWAYENDTHGKITIPKMNSFKIVDIANAISQAYGVENPTLEYVGIRNGEKIHEEMISEEESIRTDDGKKNFLVSNSIINNNIWTYNSKDHTLAIDLVSNFLKEKGVFDNIEIYKKSAFKLY